MSICPGGWGWNVKWNEILCSIFNASSVHSDHAPSLPTSAPFEIIQSNLSSDHLSREPVVLNSGSTLQLDLCQSASHIEWFEVFLCMDAGNFWPTYWHMNHEARQRLFHAWTYTHLQHTGLHLTSFDVPDGLHIIQQFSLYISMWETHHTTLIRPKYSQHNVNSNRSGWLWPTPKR